MQLVGLSRFIKPQIRVGVVETEYALPLEKIHIRLDGHLRYNLVEIVEVFLAGLGE